jgi:hypothetical protein
VVEESAQAGAGAGELILRVHVGVPRMLVVLKPGELPGGRRRRVEDARAESGGGDPDGVLKGAQGRMERLKGEGGTLGDLFGEDARKVSRSEIRRQSRSTSARCGIRGLPSAARKACL